MLRVITLAIALLAALCAAGCSSATKAKDQPTAPPPKTADAPSKRFRLDPKMMANVKFIELKEEDVPSYLTASGKVQFNEDRLANISPPVAGQVQDLKVKVGDPIQKGEVLFLIFSRDVAAAIADHNEAHKDADLAQKTFNRIMNLFEHEAASRTALDQAESDLAKAQSRLSRTEETLRAFGVGESELHSPAMSAKISVRSPLSGTIIEKKVTEGQFVQPDVNPILTIADLSTVWVSADVFERDLRFVKMGNAAEVVTAAYPDERFSARVARISDVVDPNTRAVKVRFLVSNLDQMLKPEMFASARIALKETKRGVSIPPSALFTEAGRSYAYVALDTGEFEQREIDVNQAPGGMLHVVRGLRAGEKIAADSVLLIHAEQLKGES